MQDSPICSASLLSSTLLLLMCSPFIIFPRVGTEVFAFPAMHACNLTDNSLLCSLEGRNR